jgi:hypothetical protein
MDLLRAKGIFLGCLSGEIALFKKVSEPKDSQMNLAA